MLHLRHRDGARIATTNLEQAVISTASDVAGVLVPRQGLELHIVGDGYLLAEIDVHFALPLPALRLSRQLLVSLLGQGLQGRARSFPC